jgi:hypothetical protein
MPARSVIDYVTHICRGVSPHGRRSRRRTALKLANLKAIEIIPRRGCAIR